MKEAESQHNRPHRGGKPYGGRRDYDSYNHHSSFRGDRGGRSGGSRNNFGGFSSSSRGGNSDLRLEEKFGDEGAWGKKTFLNSKKPENPGLKPSISNQSDQSSGQNTSNSGLGGRGNKRQFLDPNNQFSLLS